MSKPARETMFGLKMKTLKKLLYGVQQLIMHYHFVKRRLAAVSVFVATNKVL